VPTHEEKLLAFLEKIGQQIDTSSAFPAVEDADSNADHVETTGQPDPIIEKSEVGYAPITQRNLFVHHDTHPVVFDVALLARYDLDWFTWDPQTLWREIKDDFRVPSISDHTCAKIQAVRTLHINEWFWTKWEVFCWITQALNNNIPDFLVIQKPSISQLLNAVEIADMVRGGESFSDEVKGWVASCLVDDGVFYAPNPIAFAQDAIVQLLKELKVGEELVGAVQARYQMVMKLPDKAWTSSSDPILHETDVDIQVAKLKQAATYLTMRHRQLRDQLRLLQ
jgi:hypothetical protein